MTCFSNLRNLRSRRTPARRGNIVVCGCGGVSLLVGVFPWLQTPILSSIYQAYALDTTIQ